METTVSVQLAGRAYAILVGENGLEHLGEQMAHRLPGRQTLVVTDEHVGAKHAAPALASLRRAGFGAELLTLPPGEGTKCLRYASEIHDRLVDLNADRRAIVVALGGGVIGDLAGFVAATYARGVPFVQVPTTLLAMVDASVGGKVAVDHPRAKNMIGAFHQPALVLCDLSLLATLSDRDFRSGLAEVVKYGVILDAQFFEWLESHAEAITARQPAAIRHIVAQSCQLKARVVEQDEFETTGIRAVLNYGHTFAHAFETAAGYQGLTHGEAVAIGMICAAHLAETLGRVNANLNRRQLLLWKQLGLPTTVPAHLLRYNLIELMRRDKKARAGKLRFILPSQIGHVETVDDIDEVLVEQAIRDNVEGSPCRQPQPSSG